MCVFCSSLIESSLTPLSYHGILDQLRRDEWREVKERADQTSFECDILGNLPIEIAVLVTTHMNLADLLILQRVGMSQYLQNIPGLNTSAGIKTMAGGFIFTYSTVGCYSGSHGSRLSSTEL